jgi:hypothetical protein
MQKQKFSVTCPDVLFLKSVLVPPEQEKESVNVLSPDAPECTMLPADPSKCKKQKFGTTCPEALFVKSVLVPPELEK